jgi:diguanylate cyclase (GGDEF)-like protein/PAS domain S-box-containing protein
VSVLKGRARAALASGPVLTLVAAALFVAVTFARFLESDVNAPVTLFYVVPIAIIAVRFGSKAGLTAAGAAELAFAIWVQADGADVTTLDYLGRAVSFLALGGVAGVLAEERAQAIRVSRQMFEMSNDLLCEANLDGYFTRVNGAWEEALGWTPEELMAKPFVHFVHPEDREPTVIADATSRVKDLTHFENRYRAKSGEWHWLLWSSRSDGDRIYAVAKDITERKRSEAKRDHQLETSEAMARTDPLTGLPNRRAWDEEILKELSRAERHGLPLSLAMLDVDHFKRFNDEHGHQAGDDLLRDAGQRWRMELRTTDFIARYGGEEFGLLLPACPEDDAVAIVDRLRSKMPAGQSCSAGVACWSVGQGGDELISRADTALYAAKHAGRGRTVLAGGENSPAQNRSPGG